MLPDTTKILVTQLNDLRQQLQGMSLPVTAADESASDSTDDLTQHDTSANQLTTAERIENEAKRISLTLEMANVLNELAHSAKQSVETQNLLFEGISALETLAYTLDIQHSTHADHINIQRTLGLLYINYAAAKEDTRLLNVARKILKPLGNDDVRVLAGLLTIAVQKDEDSLSQFYAKKLIKHDGLLPTSINMATLTNYKHTDWYDELATVIKVH